jgi:hypothetical protein
LRRMRFSRVCFQMGFIANCRCRHSHPHHPFGHRRPKTSHRPQI